MPEGSCHVDQTVKNQQGLNSSRHFVRSASQFFTKDIQRENCYNVVQIEVSFVSTGRHSYKPETRFPLFGLGHISFSQKYIMPIIICTSASLSTCFLDTMAFHSFPLDFLNSLKDFTAAGVLPTKEILIVIL